LGKDLASKLEICVSQGKMRAQAEKSGGKIVLSASDASPWPRASVNATLTPADALASGPHCFRDKTIHIRDAGSEVLLGRISESRGSSF